MKKTLLYATTLLLMFGMFPNSAKANNAAGIKRALRGVSFPKIRKISFIRPGQSYKRPTYRFGARWKLRLNASSLTVSYKRDTFTVPYSSISAVLVLRSRRNVQIYLK